MLFFGAPIARRLPSLDNETEWPEWSPADSPLMPPPSCVHTPPFSQNTRTCPASLPLASFSGAPIARRLPSEEKEMLCLLVFASPAATPSMSLPTCVQTCAERL